MSGCHVDVPSNIQIIAVDEKPQLVLTNDDGDDYGCKEHSIRAKERERIEENWRKCVLLVWRLVKHMLKSSLLGYVDVHLDPLTTLFSMEREAFRSADGALPMKRIHVGCKQIINVYYIWISNNNMTLISIRLMGRQCATALRLIYDEEGRALFFIIIFPLFFL